MIPTLLSPLASYTTSKLYNKLALFKTPKVVRKQEALLHHYTERVTYPQDQPRGHLAGLARLGEGGEPGGCKGLGAVCPLPAAPSAQRQPPQCAKEAAGRRAGSLPLQGWLICEDSVGTARFAGVQIRDLREGAATGPLQAYLPHSPGSVALVSVARADPAPNPRGSA